MMDAHMHFSHDPPINFVFCAHRAAKFIAIAIEQKKKKNQWFESNTSLQPNISYFRKIVPRARKTGLWYYYA